MRWNWQRDLSHRFCFREQAMRLFVDGAVSLGVETPAGNGKQEEHWYGLFVLATQLEDEQVMRVRLERLLCWRECPQRWFQYQHMLPVLILAHAPRQRDHWQRAMEQAMQQVRVAPLVGAIAVMPERERQWCNPWQLNWRTLSTGCVCHMPDAMRPIPLTALPSSLRPDDDVMDGIGARWPSPSHPTTLVSVAPLPTRLSRIIREKRPDRLVARMPDGVGEPEMLAWLTCHVTPGQWQLMHLLLAHPLLSTEELAVFLALQRHSVRCLLSALYHLQCITPVATLVGQRWHLEVWGLRLLSAANRVPLRAIATIPDTTQVAEASEAPMVVQRGVPWLLEHIEHTAGVYSFFTHLVQAAEHRPSQALCWWESGACCECRYRVNEQWYNLRPDALAAYCDGQRHIQFWLEWDRGTMNVRDLTVKFRAYAHYLASHEWMRDHVALPMLVCVAPDIAQERRMMRVAQESLAQTPGLVLSTTTAVLLAEYGPFAAIWLRALPQQSTPEGMLRQSLFTVNDHTGEEQTTKGR